MPKEISVVSWNVKNFTKETTVKEMVVNHLKGMKPDIFAILEVVGKDVWRYMYGEFPDHNFYVTEGAQTQQILVAVRKKFRSFLTQRDEFKSGRTHLRPGPFLTIDADGDLYSFLFLHLKSFDDAEGFGLRDDMLEHAFNLKKALDDVSGGKGTAKFMFMGDLNTMGMRYWRKNRYDASIELEKLEGRAKNREMTILSKSHNSTWTNGRGKYSNLDHIVASDSIDFQSWNGHNVKVRGWNAYEEGSTEFMHFVRRVSDHCALHCRIIYE